MLNPLLPCLFYLFSQFSFTDALNHADEEGREDLTLLSFNLQTTGKGKRFSSHLCQLSIVF